MNNFYSIEGSDTIGLKVTSTGGELSLNIPDSGITLDSGWNIKTISCQVCEDFNKLFKPKFTRIYFVSIIICDLFHIII